MVTLSLIQIRINCSFSCPRRWKKAKCDITILLTGHQVGKPDRTGLVRTDGLLYPSQTGTENRTATSFFGSKNEFWQNIMVFRKQNHDLIIFRSIGGLTKFTWRKQQTEQQHLVSLYCYQWQAVSSNLKNNLIK